YTATERTRTIYKSGAQQGAVQRFKNLIGMIPVIHIPNNPGSDEAFGHPEAEALITVLLKYGEVLENALVGNHKQGRPTPTLEEMGDMASIEAFWLMFGRKESYTDKDGSTKEKWVIDFD